MDALWAQGVARMFAGQFPESSQSLRESHALARASNRQWETTTSAILIGRVEFELGNYAESQRWLSEGLALSQAQGDPVIVAFAISSLSRTMVALGRLAEMEPILRTGLRLVAEAGNRFNLGLLQEQLAQVAYATGDLNQASRLCQETITLYRELGDLWSLSRALNQMGQLELARGDEAQARQCFVETLAVALGGSFYANAVEALIGFAVVQSRKGSKAWALELALHAQQHPAATDHTWTRAEKLRAELAAQVTPQQIEEVEAQAAAKTFETAVAEILREHTGVGNGLG
jgi:tetratricopeptide (TPR) repeat protein